MNKNGCFFIRNKVGGLKPTAMRHHCLALPWHVRILRGHDDPMGGIDNTPRHATNHQPILSLTFGLHMGKKNTMGSLQMKGMVDGRNERCALQFILNAYFLQAHQYLLYGVARLRTEISFIKNVKK